jgi:hypothetical protein
MLYREREKRQYIWKGDSVTDKKASTTLLLLFILFSATTLFGKGKNKKQDNEPITLHGAIEDSQCAFNVHSNDRSHEWMITKGVEGATDARSCTLHCVKKMGGNFVLVVKNDVYRLDDQGLAEKFAGAKVRATGTVDAKTHTLHLVKMEEDQ